MYISIKALPDPSTFTMHLLRKSGSQTTWTCSRTRAQTLTSPRSAPRERILDVAPVPQTQPTISNATTRTSVFHEPSLRFALQLADVVRAACLRGRHPEVLLADFSPTLIGVVAETCIRHVYHGSGR